MSVYGGLTKIKIHSVNDKLVSIIVPAYNRADLIIDTLDSIAAQTYKNWECIIVDDGSTDNTVDVLKAYCKKDARFFWSRRPVGNKKGANACRNHGLEKSKGSLINWFDSDDIMHPDFLSVKVNEITQRNFDFVISSSVDWHADGTETPIYENTNAGKKISSYNFIKQYINCITNDFMATRESISNLRFNEFLKSGQEYNFISRYLCTTTNGRFFDTVLSKRRVHSESIQSEINVLKDTNELDYNKQILINKYYLLQDIMTIGDDRSKNYLIEGIMKTGYFLVQIKDGIPFYDRIIPMLKQIKGTRKTKYYKLALFSLRNFGKGYRILKKATS